MYERHIGEVATERLEQMAEAVVGGREVFHAAADRFGWEPGPGSEAARDFANSEVGPGGPWGTVPVRHLQQLAGLYVRVASDHMAGIGALYRAGEVFYAPSPLIRAVMEHCTRVSWLIDPGATTRQRCARAALEELVTSEESRKTVKHLGGESTEAFAQTQQTYDGLRAEVRDLFHAVDLQDSKFKWRIETENLASPTDAAKLFAELHSPSVDGGGMYDALCLYTHPNGFTSREGPRLIAPGETKTVVELDIDYVTRLTSAALSPFYSALTLLLNYHDWHLPELREWEVAMERADPNIFRTGSSR